MTVRHVASMTSGHLRDTRDRAFAADPDEPVRGFLLVPPDREPGTIFAYNQPCSYALAAIIQRLSGHTLSEYLRPRLLDPLGIGPVASLQRPAGRDLGYSGLHATTDAIAKLGQLYLQGGIWEGRRVLPAAWVAEATRLQIPTPTEPQPDWQQGYGFQFWRSRHGYRGDGAYGQFCLVLPEHHVVLATTAATENMQGVLDAVWDHLLPALAPAPLRPSRAGADLADRLAALELLPRRPTPADPDAPAELRFSPAGAGCEHQPTLTGVVLRRVGAEWRLTLVEDAARVALVVGAHGWRTSVSADLPVAAAGGWTDPSTFEADVILLETPHRLTVRCSRPDGTFRAIWHTRPVPPRPLSQLRMPRSG